MKWGWKIRDSKKPNFSFRAQFGGKLRECEKQTKTIRKNDQKPISSKLLKDEMGLKSRHPQKAYPRPLRNVHN